jgi:hypothetical protein
VVVWTALRWAAFSVERGYVVPTIGPAPEWDWYDNTDLKIGEARHDVHHFLYDEEYSEYLEEIKAKEKRRIKPGFHVQDTKRRSQRRRNP